eukprot:IDg13421t1
MRAIGRTCLGRPTAFPLAFSTVPYDMRAVSVRCARDCAHIKTHSHAPGRDRCGRCRFARAKRNTKPRCRGRPVLALRAERRGRHGNGCRSVSTSFAQHGRCCALPTQRAARADHPLPDLVCIALFCSVLPIHIVHPNAQLCAARGGAVMQY